MALMDRHREREPIHYVSLNLASEYLARLATSLYVLPFFALVLTHGFYQCLLISLIVKNHVKTVKVSSKAKKGKKTECQF